ncbi:MAG: hypothetical protein ACI82A_003581, partial [Candidatus Azotimanducaceae bacterium]
QTNTPRDKARGTKTTPSEKDPARHNGHLFT